MAGLAVWGGVGWCWMFASTCGIEHRPSILVTVHDHSLRMRDINRLTGRGREQRPLLFGASIDSLDSPRATVIVGHRFGYPDACHHCPLSHGLSDFLASPPARIHRAGSLIRNPFISI